MLKRSDPFKPLGCRYGDPSCIVEEGKDCAQTGLIYEITCQACNGQNSPTSRGPGSATSYNYIGMTRTSAHWRMLNHLDGQKRRQTKNPLHRHDCDIHGGAAQTYKTRILSKERNLLPLCILEGLYIERQIEGTSFNDRNDAGRGDLVRLTAQRVT